MTSKDVDLDSRTLADVLKNTTVKIKHSPDAETFKILLGLAAVELILGTDGDRQIKINVKALKKPFGKFLQGLYDRLGWVTWAENRLEIKRNSALLHRPLRRTYTRAKAKVGHSLKSLSEAAEILIEEQNKLKWARPQFRECQKELKILHEKIAAVEGFLAFLIDSTIRTDYEKTIAINHEIPKEYPLGQGSQQLFFDMVLSLDKLIGDFERESCLNIPRKRVDAFIIRFCTEMKIQSTTEENLHMIRRRSRKTNTTKPKSGSSVPRN